MSAETTEATKKKKVIWSTPQGVAVWPRLNEPDSKFKKEGEYSVALRVKKEEGEKFLKQVKGEIKKALDFHLAATKKSKLKLAPFPVIPEEDENGTETGFYLIRAKLTAGGTTKAGKTWTAKPFLIDAKMRPCPNAQIGAGSILKLALEPRGYYVGAVGVGVQLRIAGVQVIELVEYTPGQSANPEEMGFEEEEGWEAGDEGATKSGVKDSDDSLEDSTDDSADDLEPDTDSDSDNLDF